MQSLVKRADGRVDRRRELAGLTASERTNWLQRATHIFDLLADILRDRVLVVDNSNPSSAERDRMADRVAALVGAGRETSRPPGAQRC
jgi:hypothetical protein